MEENNKCVQCVTIPNVADKTAEYWCTCCRLILCKSCMESHKFVNAMHVFIPYEKVQELSSEVMNLSMYCGDHTDCKVILFCIPHDKIICDTCQKNAHSSCDIVPIENAAKGVKESSAFCELQKRIQNVIARLEANDNDVCSIPRLQSFKQYEKDLELIKTFGEEIHIFQTIKTIDYELFILFSSDKTKESSVYVEATLHSKSQAVKSNQSLLLKASFKTTQLRHKATVTYCCFVSGGRLLMIDYWNKCLYLSDYEASDVFTILLPSKPKDMTIYDTITALVALGEHGIALVNYVSMVVEKRIMIHGDCSSITSQNENIWVVTGDLEITKININGEILLHLIIEHWIKDFCINSQRKIFFTTYENSNIYCLTHGSKEKQFGNIHDLDKPFGIVIDGNDNILVVEENGHCIRWISADSNSTRNMLCNGICWPTRISYNKDNDYMAIVHSNQETVSIVKYIC